ncbi:hypothetical protein DFR49_0953 [Hephaestia caeni]|uniref:DUF7831 domain-containing protein n=1 Tax=Hephaestia caeni TaxID=645617 RepID=A0A397PBE4_9SPHN|nr:hypothetical protein [Hephaestia caeni]RIA46412.1 hypothetical protein DFR49_0953 [Hephaestia caeni]
MPIIVQTAWLTRHQLRSTPSTLFAWGDNLARMGGAQNPRSGQAFACRGEPNAIGIPTKQRPSMEDSAFFDDNDFDRVRPEIDVAFARLSEHIAAGGTVVWPADGIGTGRAELARRAPRIWIYLEQRRERLFALGEVILR